MLLLKKKDTKIMDPILGGALVSAGGGLVNNALGMLSAKRQNKRQQKQMDYSQKLSKELWDYTNAGNQVKHYKDAGLNVGLMYDKGGTSASTGSFGTNAPMDQVQGMDIASNMMAQSQIELNKAQAEKLKVETGKIGGVDTELTKTQIDSNKITNDFNTMNFDTALEKSKSELNNINANTEKAVADGTLSKIDGITRAWENTSNVLNTIANTSKLQADVKQGWEKIAQGWKDLELKTRGLDIEETKVKINEFQAETQRNYPSLMQSAGGVMNDGLKAIYMMLGFNKENQPTTSKVNQ